jgi:O-glycosyl hydrolase
VLIASFCVSIAPLLAQLATELPPRPQQTSSTKAAFQFISDGPIGPGWSRPDEIARTYFNDELPAFFTRTIVLDNDLPKNAKLSWIFTGPHAGFTVTISPSKLRVVQRYYDSQGLFGQQGNYPEKMVRDDTQQFEGRAQVITVVLDSHLALSVLLNGKEVLKQSCLFDVSRHQLMLSAPRAEHDVVAGQLLEDAAANTTVSVNIAERHQQMMGFGGSPSIPAYARLSDEGKARYWELLKRYNLLLDREYPMGTELKQDMSNLADLGSATPHYYGDNFPNGEVSDFDYSKHALALGGSVIYEMWALPAWATQSYVSSGTPVVDSWNKVIRTAAKPDEYARAVVAYCKMAKEHTGSAPAIIGVQNEVEEPPEIFDAMVLALRKELDRAGFAAVKIHMADASYMWQGVQRARRLQHNPDVWKAIDFTAAHEYDYQEFFANPDMYDSRLAEMRAASAEKPFLATEICINDPMYQELSYRIAFNAGQLYHKNLADLDAVAIMYCWLLLDIEEPSFGGSRSLLVADRSRGYVPVASSFELRVFGAFSRHILKGMYRVGVTSSNADLLASAYDDGAGRSTLVMMNRSTEVQRLTTNWAGKRWVEMERTSPWLENSTSANTSSEVMIQPGEIVVLSTFEASR